MKGKGKIVESGAIELGKGAKLTDTDLSGNTGTVTYNVTHGVGADGLSSLVDKFTTSSGQTAQAFSGLLEKQQTQLGALAEGKQTDGDAGRNKIVVIVVVAVLVLVGLFIWKARK